jgi:hypothetical protein
MNGLGEYLLLAVVPMAAIAVQTLYMKAGSRYDLGAGWYVAMGFVIATRIPPRADASLIGNDIIAWSIAVGSLLFVVRIWVVAKGTPMQFTILGLAQMWSTVPLLSFIIIDSGSYSGLSVGRYLEPWQALALSTCIAAVGRFSISRRFLSSRLRAMTDAPDYFSVLIGSRYRLAIELEALACGSYLAAGFAMRLAFENLAPADFGTELLWIIICAATAPQAALRRGSSARVLWAFFVAPVVLALARLGVRSTLSPYLAQAATYGLLAAVIGLSVMWERKGESFVRS